MKIAKETWIIMVIGIADLATTILFIKHHGAQEANPLFKRYWEMGLMAFVAAKAAMLVGPLIVLEWARIRNPRFVSWALRSAIAGYLIMYGVGYFRLNHPKTLEQEYANLPAPPLCMSTRVVGRIRPMLPSRAMTQSPRVRTMAETVTVY